MYVPDPGLMAKIDNLLKETGEFFMDCRVCCPDGHFFCNSLLLAASSKLIKISLSEIYYDCDVSEPVLVIPNFKKNFVRQILRKLFEFGNLDFNNQELGFLKLLGIHGQEARVEKVVQILGVNNSSFKTEESYHRSVLRLNEGDENDVDIIFENQSEVGSEEADLESMFMEDLGTMVDEVEEGMEVEEQGSQGHEIEEKEMEEWKEEEENEDEVDVDVDVDDPDEDPLQCNEQSLHVMEIEKGGDTSEKQPKKRRKLKQTKKFACSHCKQRFDVREFRKHREENPTHFLKRPGPELTCRLCDLEFVSKGMAGFREHVATHKDPEGGFSCPQCGKKTNTWGHLMQHMYRHGWKRPYRCSYCSYDSINKSNIAKHEKAKHEAPDLREFDCHICNKKFKIPGQLSAHLKTHEDIKHACDVCEKLFKSDLGLSQHKRIHNGETIPCLVCGEHYLSEHSTKRHERDLHGYFRDTSGDRKFLCKANGCDAAFLTEEEKKAHSRREHMDKSSIFSCQSCSITFTNKNFLRLHKKEAHPGSLMRRQQRAGKSLLRPEDKTEMVSLPVKIKNTAQKRSIILRNELDPSEHKCDCCQQTFKYSYEMLTHTIVQENKGLYCSFESCIHQTKPFHEEHELLAHMLKHTGENVYRCTYCDKGFHRENLLKKHENTHNVALMQFTCPAQDCGTVFFNVKSFDDHMVVHDPEHNKSNYTCYICTQQFDNIESKEEHTMNEHPTIVTSFSCTHCGERQPSILVHKMHEKYCKNNKLVEAAPTFKCSFCSEIMSSTAGKMLHEKHCRKNVKYVTELTVEAVEESPVEIYTSQQDDINSYFYDICKICKKIFVNFTEYVDHLRQEHTSETTENEVDCNICTNTLLLSELDDHLKLYHSLGSLFKCEECEATFNKLEEFEEHNDTYHDHLDGFTWIHKISKFACNFCGKYFKTKTGVTRHLHFYHKDQYTGIQEQLQIVLDENPVASTEELALLNDQENQGIIINSQLINSTNQFVNPSGSNKVGQHQRQLGHQVVQLEQREGQLLDSGEQLVDMLDVVVTDEDFSNKVVIQVEREDDYENIVASLLPH